MKRLNTDWWRLIARLQFIDIIKDSPLLHREMEQSYPQVDMYSENWNTLISRLPTITDHEHKCQECNDDLDWDFHRRHDGYLCKDCSQKRRRQRHNNKDT